MKYKDSTLPVNLQNAENYTGMLLLASGLFEQTCSCAAGELVRLKTVNALSGANSLMLNIGFVAGADTCEMNVLAYDGVYLSIPRPQTSVKLPPGGRVDFAISCRQGGHYQLGTVPYDETEPFGNAFPHSHIILHLHVSEAVTEYSLTSRAEYTRVHALPAKLPGPPAYYKDLRKLQPDGYNTIVFSDKIDHKVVNGWLYNGSSSYTMPQWSVQEWHLFSRELISATDPSGVQAGFLKLHPYHHHTTHFQVVESEGDPLGLVASVGDWRDTLPIYRDLNFTVRFVPPFPGLVMVHCHILKHEDAGMMTLAKVTPALPNLVPWV